eukprot:931992-Rhodomonas_salina.1
MKHVPARSWRVGVEDWSFQIMVLRGVDGVDLGRGELGSSASGARVVWMESRDGTDAQDVTGGDWRVQGGVERALRDHGERHHRGQWR